MTVCSHCGHAVIDDVSFADQIGLAQNEFSQRKPKAQAIFFSSNNQELFDALTYLGRSRDYNDMVAFHLLYQIFVDLSRHDRMEDWPTLEEMWKRATEKTQEAMLSH